jgi:hypothetical protein
MKLALFLLFASLLFAEEPAGKIVSKRGDVFVVRNFETYDTKEGYELIPKDIVVTSDGAKAKLLFKDGTKVTVGKNSIFEVTEFMFDKTERSKAKFRAKHGFFSVVTGEVGKVARDNFKLKTKTATIGVRGTEFEGNVTLKGEGVKCLKGVVTVAAKGKTIELKEGEALDISPELFENGEPPTTVGKIETILGNVFVISGKRTKLATVGMELFPRDIVVTSYKSKSCIRLNSDNRVKIERNSGCMVDFKDGAERVTSVKGVVSVGDENKLLKGEYFDVQ